MATVTHIIRSHYDPADREKLELETGQRTNDDTSDPWQTESSFSAQRRIRAAPTFVPATISYDEWGVPSHTSSPAVARAREEPDQPRTSTAEWYRSLTASSSSSRQTPPPPRSSSAPSLPSQDARLRIRPPQTTRRRREKHLTKNDYWFIRKALCSEPSTKPGSPALSLADLLARDPPLLPSEGRYTPPVWLHIGPSNRGFGMLQRGGWNEGEGLGAHVVRRVARAKDVDVDERPRPSSCVEVEEDVADVQTNAPEVIDLTLSDSEASEDATFEEEDDIQELGQTQPYTGDVSASHMQKSLLTPLPTILKADRLGIGMKAKTEGPYKQSKKRVTHNAAALAAHIRSAEEMRRSKAAVGKGKRGFAKIHKREEDRRKAMLAYLQE
ncbi:hypothetical protein JVT61DRAFT_1136 [Boletus reticuloceps]|uniref:G-patch domain-containing protein n=1 Tax=Boletus reticuloceps TaxID=495285 RepID=A0A8I2YS25_9AGAM|nr:hypothetical protein JVT61DRAFT_1136 [Boletus reticuloceps]